jgi:hypothetical protein
MKTLHQTLCLLQFANGAYLDCPGDKYGLFVCPAIEGMWLQGYCADGLAISGKVYAMVGKTPVE